MELKFIHYEKAAKYEKNLSPVLTKQVFLPSKVKTSGIFVEKFGGNKIGGLIIIIKQVSLYLYKNFVKIPNSFSGIYVVCTRVCTSFMGKFLISTSENIYFYLFKVGVTLGW